MKFYDIKQRLNRYRFRYVMKRVDESIINYTTYVSKKNNMEHFALHSKESGISTEKICEEELIVSLTTFGKRYYDVCIAIESIMQGTVKPNHIVLWVSNEFNEVPIPVTLKNQIERGLEIRYVKDLKSYTKLYYCLEEFPEASIITIDDDVIYPYDTIENLVNAHKKDKNCICANDYLIVPDQLDSNLRLMDWERPKQYLEISAKCVFEGFAGVLYPPHSLSDEVFNDNVFLNICSTSDDVWFSAMAMINGTKCLYACPHIDGFQLVSNYSVQSVALSKLNTELNQINICNVFKKYSLY